MRCNTEKTSAKTERYASDEVQIACGQARGFGIRDRPSARLACASHCVRAAFDAIYKVAKELPKELKAELLKE